MLKRPEITPQQSAAAWQEFCNASGYEWNNDEELFFSDGYVYGVYDEFARCNAVNAALLAACKAAPVVCPMCGGDGKETCDNPDHGFISAMPGDIGRLGCPVCGHDEYFKVPGGGQCELCEGIGSVALSKAMDAYGDRLVDRVDYFAEANAIEPILAACAAIRLAETGGAAAEPTDG